MKVLNIGTSEMEIIKEALDSKIEEEMDLGEMDDYDFAHLRTTRKLLQDQRLQELCERCLSYFWDMYKEMGGFCDLLEELIDDMGITEEELVELFKEAGFEEEYNTRRVDPGINWMWYYTDTKEEGEKWYEEFGGK